MCSIGFSQLQVRSVVFSSGVLGALLGIFVSLPGSATTFYERPFDQTVQNAPTIVRGIIGNSYTDWSKGEDGTKRIYTYFDLQVTEILKGTAPMPNLVLRQMGGEKDGVGLQIAGSASFERGEDVVVFMGTRVPDGSFELLGMSMGKLNIERDERGREYLVGAAIPGNGGDAHHHEGGQPDSGKASQWSLDQLRNMIHQQDGAKIVQNQNLKAEIAKPSPPDAMQSIAAPQLQPPIAEKAEGAHSPSEAFGGIVGLLLKILGILLLVAIVSIWILKRR